ncbi:hypothetical protein GWK47_016516 [Chionoecetes opilio]|uniref:Uncharacterized protein n=1 Tax=Chionoecetes opilio TaxID=41210 RepID=A0A8J4XWH4_CHIOP|nr:hypothetical protein GWK47_016516 [Chionoecetes opilio]
MGHRDAVFTDEQWGFIIKPTSQEVYILRGIPEEAVLLKGAYHALSTETCIVAVRWSQEKPARCNVAEDYQARMCEAGWFMRVKPGQLVSQEDEFGAQKFAADYLFLSKSYDAAAAKYEDILSSLPESNTTSKRECQENLVRCHIKLGIPDKAVVHAEKLHSSSRTFDQFTVSYSVLLDVYLAAGRHNDALTAAQNLVSRHPDNNHLWMKLAYVYALLRKVTLPNVRELIHAHCPASVITAGCINPVSASEAPQLQKNSPDYLHNIHEGGLRQCHEEVKNTKRDVLIVAACLQRAYYNLVKTEGTAVGFAVPHTRTLKEKLLGDLKLLLDECSLKELRKNVHHNDKVEMTSCPSESDPNREESMKGRTKDENREVCVSKENFEEMWFKWIL